jgi:hypothetical protein
LNPPEIEGEQSRQLFYSIYAWVCWLTDRIFFVNVNLRPRISRFRDSEYPLILNVMHGAA